MSQNPIPSALEHRNCSIALSWRLPRFQSTSAYRRSFLNKVNVLPIEPVLVGVGDPMKTNGALAHATAGCPGPPSHRMSEGAPVVGSTVADTTFLVKKDSIGKPGTLNWPGLVTSEGRPPRLMILLWVVAQLPEMSQPKFLYLSTARVACNSIP